MKKYLYILLFISPAIHAKEITYSWTGTFVDNTWSSAPEIRQYAQDVCEQAGHTWTDPKSESEPGNCSSNISMGVHHYDDGTFCVDKDGQDRFTYFSPHLCDGPFDECPAVDTYGYEVPFYDFDGQPPLTECVSGCVYGLVNNVDFSADGATNLLAAYSSNGQECENGNYPDGSDSPFDIQDLPKLEDYTFEEMDFTFTENDDQCYIINGSEVCNTDYENGCYTSPQGITICQEDATDQPDTGTPGQTAQPDITIENVNNETTTVVFNETTTNNSSTNDTNDTGDSDQATFCQDNPGAAICQSASTPENSNICAEDPTILACQTAPTGTPGDLYQEETRTVSDSFNDFRSQIDDTALIGTVGTFFTAEISGSCPTWTADVGFTSVTIDQFCSDLMETLWPVISTGLFLVASFFAVRIALDN